jgi:hypothetical protein
LVINPPTPGTYAHEFFQVSKPVKDPARRAAHQKPYAEDEQYLQHGTAIEHHERMTRKNQERQFQQVFKVAKREDNQKTKVLIQAYVHQARILFNHIISSPKPFAEESGRIALFQRSSARRGHGLLAA